MTKHKQTETVVASPQTLHLDASTAESVGAYIDYMRAADITISRQQAMNILIRRGWASMNPAAAELAREREQNEEMSK
jgi:hypothetical protein